MVRKDYSLVCSNTKAKCIQSRESHKIKLTHAGQYDPLMPTQIPPTRCHGVLLVYLMNILNQGQLIAKIGIDDFKNHFPGQYLPSKKELETEDRWSWVFFSQGAAKRARRRHAGVLTAPENTHRALKKREKDAIACLRKEEVSNHFSLSLADLPPETPQCAL